MPIIVKAEWKTVHKWESSKWKTWTDQMMVDELHELDYFRKRNRIKYSLREFLLYIVEHGDFVKGNKHIDFRALQSLIECWKHLTSCCGNYGREWIAQDESRLVCFLGKSCNGYNNNCSDYKPMLEARTIEELIKEEKVVFN